MDVDTHSVYVGVGGHLGESPSNHTRPGEHAQAVEVSRRPLPCRGLLLFSGTAFLSKKDERALMLLEFLLIYSLHFVYKQAVARVFSLVRRESLVVMLWGSLT